ncbi:MAG: NADPH:quinone oxidoreductase family protein, partial [Octadecabacter sp.]
MKAWLCKESTLIEDIAVFDQPVPQGDVVIRVTAAAVNFSDILMIQDAYQIKPPRPFIPGQEIAGTVISATENSGFSVGDRVASKVNWGGFGEVVAVPANMPFQIPDTLSFATAAALPVSYTTAMVGLTECVTLTKGMWVLVHAASGAVGLAAVEIATALGARVIATASTAEKRAIAAAHGAEITVDYTADGWAKTVKEATGGGANVVFDPVGGDIGEQSLRAIARDGTHLVVGFAAGR